VPAIFSDASARFDLIGVNPRKNRAVAGLRPWSAGRSGRLFGKAARVGSATRIALAFRPGATADGRRRRACASDCAGIHAGANARETWR